MEATFPLTPGLPTMWIGGTTHSSLTGQAALRRVASTVPALQNTRLSLAHACSGLRRFPPIRYRPWPCRPYWPHLSQFVVPGGTSIQPGRVRRVHDGTCLGARNIAPLSLHSQVLPRAIVSAAIAVQHRQDRPYAFAQSPNSGGVLGLLNGISPWYV